MKKSIRSFIKKNAFLLGFIITLCALPLFVSFLNLQKRPAKIIDLAGSTAYTHKRTPKTFEQLIELTSKEEKSLQKIFFGKPSKEENKGHLRENSYTDTDSFQASNRLDWINEQKTLDKIHLRNKLLYPNNEEAVNTKKIAKIVQEKTYTKAFDKLQNQTKEERSELLNQVSDPKKMIQVLPDANTEELKHLVTNEIMPDFSNVALPKASFGGKIAEMITSLPKELLLAVTLVAVSIKYRDPIIHFMKGFTSIITGTNQKEASNVILHGTSTIQEIHKRNTWGKGHLDIINNNDQVKNSIASTLDFLYAITLGAPSALLTAITRNTVTPAMLYIMCIAFGILVYYFRTPIKKMYPYFYDVLPDSIKSLLSRWKKNLLALWKENAPAFLKDKPTLMTLLLFELSCIICYMLFLYNPNEPYDQLLPFIHTSRFGSLSIFDPIVLLIKTLGFCWNTIVCYIHYPSKMLEAILSNINALAFLSTLAGVLYYFHKKHQQKSKLDKKQELRDNYLARKKVYDQHKNDPNMQELPYIKALKKFFDESEDFNTWAKKERDESETWFHYIPYAANQDTHELYQLFIKEDENGTKEINVDKVRKYLTMLLEEKLFFAKYDVLKRIKKSKEEKTDTYNPTPKTLFEEADKEQQSTRPTLHIERLYLPIPDKKKKDKKEESDTEKSKATKEVTKTHYFDGNFTKPINVIIGDTNTSTKRLEAIYQNLIFQNIDGIVTAQEFSGTKPDTFYYIKGTEQAMWERFNQYYYQAENNPTQKMLLLVSLGATGHDNEKKLIGYLKAFAKTPNVTLLIAVSNPTIYTTIWQDTTLHDLFSFTQIHLDENRKPTGMLEPFIQSDVNAYRGIKVTKNTPEKISRAIVEGFKHDPSLTGQQYYFSFSGSDHTQSYYMLLFIMVIFMLLSLLLFFVTRKKSIAHTTSDSIEYIPH